MSTVISEIEKLLDGADFYKADMHIHSLGEGGSYDVKDPDMTVENIVDTAISKNISVISITDHNGVDNCAKAIQYAEGKKILVVPGVEITTNEGHLLVFAKTTQQIRSILGKQKFTEDGKHCLSTMSQCIDSASEFGGFAIAAHIDKDTGFENKIQGYGAAKKAVILHKDLLAFEVTSPSLLSWYTADDLIPERKVLAAEEVVSRSFTVKDRARVMFSDAHNLQAIGLNLNGKERVTRIKLAEFSFEAIHTAFMDPVARIRVEDDIPETIPYFIGIKYEGGFLDGQTIKFNKNLNCIIGGRGSGKSTLIESLKITSGNKTNSKNEDRLVDSEVWPERTVLIYGDEVGNVHELARNKHDIVLNMTDPIDGLTTIPIESYGQGETQETIQNSDSEPRLLAEFLDRFIDFGNLKIDDDQIRAELLDNHQKIRNLEAELIQLPEYKKLLADANNKLDALKKQNVRDLVILEQALSVERSLRTELLDEIQRHQLLFSQNMDATNLLNIDDMITGKKIMAGKVELKNIQELIEQYTKLAEKTSKDFNDKVTAVLGQIHTNLDDWKRKEANLVTRIEAKKQELIAQNIRPDMGFIQATTTSASNYTIKIKRLEAQQVELKKLIARRKELITGRNSIKTQIFMKRISFARKINSRLGDTIDYAVKLDFKHGLNSEALCELLQTSMGWRTSQVPKAKIISESVTCNDLVNMLDTKNIGVLTGIKDTVGNQLLSKSDAEEVYRVLAQPDTRRDIEELLYDDRPQIKVTKTVDDGGTPRVLVRSFHQLSLGQQHAIFLTILLHSDKNTPLIIDQPEDDLDSEFIYKTIVATLKHIKERRQVIVVTHNANIAVLGDAELILPLRSSNDKAVIKDRGSIDAEPTKKLACTILEGGEKAFLRRAEMYNI